MVGDVVFISYLYIFHSSYNIIFIIITNNCLESKPHYLNEGFKSWMKQFGLTLGWSSVKFSLSLLKERKGKINY